MLKIRMERHLNSCFHREDTRTFDTFAELEEWIFDQMQQDYTGCKMTLRFPTSEIAQCFHDDARAASRFIPLLTESSFGFTRLKHRRESSSLMAGILLGKSSGHRRFRRGSRTVSSAA